MHLHVECLTLKTNASRGDKSTGNPHRQLLNQEVAPPLVSTTDTKSTKLHIFIFCTVLFPFLLSKACFNRERRKVLSLALFIICVTICIYESY
jgi:hypothetical protein